MENRESIFSTINSLKDIVTIVTGITITNSVVVFITGGDYLNVKGFKEFNLELIILFLLLTVNIIRFYHGNIRHLDSSYLVKSNDCGDIKQSKYGAIGIDFFVIFIQSLLFASLSFYLTKPIEFVMIFSILLMVDVLWFLSVYQYTEDRKIFEHQRKWGLNNTSAVFLLLGATIANNFINNNFLFILFTLIVTLNTIIDFKINWSFYFPLISKKKISTEDQDSIS